MLISSATFLILTAAITFISPLIEVFLDPGYVIGQVGRELHVGSYTFILTSYFSAPTQPALQVLLALSMICFGLTAVCVAGARDKLPRKWRYYAPLSLMVGFGFWTSGLCAAIMFWP